jgi:hypothetical protein
LKATTFVAEELEDPLPVFCTVIWVAVIVVPSVVPRTRTGSPVVMALDDVELVPFWYVVPDASLMVTFWPADVDRVNPELVSALTVPTVPPAAGPDRALDAPPPDLGAPLGAPEEGGALVEVLLAVVEPPLEVALTIP